MKRILLFAMIAATTLPIFAELSGNGYYRVRSAYTKRFAYLLDDKGSYNISTTSADVGSLKLYADRERTFSDPASVFYIEEAPHGNDFYNIEGQGTSIYDFINIYLSIYKDRSDYDGEPTYSIYASKSGLVKYIGDIWDDPREDEGLASAEAKGDYRRWNIYPIDVESDEYFGVLPTVDSGDKHYAAFFSSFPFSAYSEGMKFFTVSEIDSRGAAIISEIEGAVPSATPVIIECSSQHPSDNRLTIGVEAQPVSGNLLKGIYFDNPSKVHFNRTPFDKTTMRILGIGSDGRPAFVEADYEYIPRNHAFLQLTDPEQYAVKEFTLMTSEQRELELNAVDVIPVGAMVDVYGIDGRLVKAGIAKSDVQSLGKGVYVLKNDGKSQKMIVH